MARDGTGADVVELGKFRDQDKERQGCRGGEENSHRSRPAAARWREQELPPRQSAGRELHEADTHETSGTLRQGCAQNVAGPHSISLETFRYSA